MKKESFEFIGGAVCVLVVVALMFAVMAVIR